MVLFVVIALWVCREIMLMHSVKKVFLSEFVIVWLTSRDVGLQPKKIILCVLNFNEMMTELSLKFMRC